MWVKGDVTKCRKDDVCVIVVMQMCDHVWSLSKFHSSKQADDEMQCSRGETCPVTKVCVCVCLTGGPAGPGGPLLSWVQVQALGKAGQSTSFLWMTTAWWGWHKEKTKANK